MFLLRLRRGGWFCFGRDAWSFTHGSVQQHCGVGRGKVFHLIQEPQVRSGLVPVEEPDDVEGQVHGPQNAGQASEESSQGRGGQP